MADISKFSERSIKLFPLLAYSVFIGLPILALLIRALAVDDIIVTLRSEIVISALRLSIFTSVNSMILVLLIGTPVGYLLARKNFPGLWLIDSMIELPILLPPVVAGLAMLMAFGRNGLIGHWLVGLNIDISFSTAAVIFAQLFVSAPFYIRSAKLGFKGVDRTYEELSYTLGKSPWVTFWKISIPLAMPSLLGGLALSWGRAISEFGATIMFAGNFLGKTQTMPLAILTAMESDLGAAVIISVFLLAFAVLFLVVAGLFGKIAGNWK